MTAASDRILVLAPSGRDGQLAVTLLAQHELVAEPCRTVVELVDAIPTAGCAIIATEALDAGARETLREALAAQPPWSDFPIILLASRGAGVMRDAIEITSLFGNVTLLERPLQSRTLLSAVVGALRARRRQYEARQAIVQRDQFLAMLGHELRNPLAAIMLASESQREAGTATRQSEIIERQSKHLARLVDDLLDVARVTTGKVRLKPERVELCDLVEKCVQGARLRVAGRQIGMRCDAPRPMLVHGDPVRLEEIFNNLIGNALKYSKPETPVEVAMRVDGSRVRVDIVDHGIGIAPEMLRHVFELFAQVEGSLARSEGGLGIGLTLVSALVELHHGRVEASSAGLGQGSTFTVWLPRLREAEQAIRATTQPNALARPLRIVLVEDNMDLLEMTKALLEMMGHTVAATASDGVDGVSAIAREQPDLAIVDIGLPELDGYEVAKRVRSGPTPAPFLVAMTGYGQASDRQRALEAGYNEHLTKPVTRTLLDRAVALVGDHSARASAVP